MKRDSTKASTAALDEARAFRCAGDLEGALRLGVAILEKDASQLHAALLVARTLIDDDRPFLATEVAARLVGAFVRRGDLPSAVVAADAADRGLDDGSYLSDAADAFGAGSSRLGEGAVSPPPFPAEVTVGPELRKLTGEPLLDRAETALQGYFSTEDDIAEDASIATWPLFSDLEPAALQELLGAMSVEDIAVGDLLITEGEEGTRAYVLAAGMLEVARGEGEERTVLAHLGPGALFGEMALVSEAPRAGTVKALEASTVLCVERKDLERLTEATPEIGLRLAQFCRGRMVSNLMRHSAILGAVDAKDRESLMNRFEQRIFEPGDVLVKEGDEANGLLLIASGSVEVVTRDEDGDSLRIAELGPGDVVGEISLVLRRPANASVRALHPTVALLLSRDEFQEAIRQYPTLLGELYEMATQRDEETRSVVAQEAFDLGEVLV